LNLRILINNYWWFKFKSLHNSSLYVQTKKTTTTTKTQKSKKQTKGLAPLPPQLLFYLLARERVALARATMMRADKDDSKVRAALAWVTSDDDYDNDDEKGKGDNDSKGDNDGKGGKYW
jgi:hypothetical protein